MICVVEYSLSRRQTLAMPASPISKRYTSSASTRDHVVDFANLENEEIGKVQITSDLSLKINAGMTSPLVILFFYNRIPLYLILFDTTFFHTFPK